MLDDAWSRQVEAEIENIKYRVAQKVDRFSVEAIERMQEETIHKLTIADNLGELASNMDTDADAERICLECVQAGDLNAAFATILRYIDQISQTKAERKDVNGKATTTYVEDLFKRLGSLTRQQLEDSTKGLEYALEARIQTLEDEFTSMRNDITRQVSDAEKSITELEESVFRYTSTVDQNSLVKTRWSNSTKENILLLPRERQFQSQTDLTPRRQMLKRSFEASHRRTGSRLQSPTVRELFSSMQITTK